MNQEIERLIKLNVIRDLELQVMKFKAIAITMDYDVLETMLHDYEMDEINKQQ